MRAVCFYANFFPPHDFFFLNPISPIYVPYNIILYTYSKREYTKINLARVRYVIIYTDKSYKILKTYTFRMLLLYYSIYVFIFDR